MKNHAHNQDDEGNDDSVEVRYVHVEMNAPRALTGSPYEIGSKAIADFIEPVLDMAHKVMDDDQLANLYVGTVARLLMNCVNQLGADKQKYVLGMITRIPPDVYSEFVIERAFKARQGDGKHDA